MAVAGGARILAAAAGTARSQSLLREGAWSRRWQCDANAFFRCSNVPVVIILADVGSSGPARKLPFEMHPPGQTDTHDTCR